MIHDLDLDFAQMRVGLCEALYINVSNEIIGVRPPSTWIFQHFFTFWTF